MAFAKNWKYKNFEITITQNRKKKRRQMELRRRASKTINSIMRIKSFVFTYLFLNVTFFLHAQYRMEYLTRGVHAVNAWQWKVFISWRFIGYGRHFARL
jgi:hypothetical protein